jgi:D-alanyl-D-alanine carboxypeptidase
MIRRHWRDPYATLEGYYGLGIISGKTGDWERFGHSGGFQASSLHATAVLPERDLTLSVLTNAVDGLAHPWLDGIMHILQAFARHGAPAARMRDWRGRLVEPVGRRRSRADGHREGADRRPGLAIPFMDASELSLSARDRGRIALANGYAKSRRNRAPRARPAPATLRKSGSVSPAPCRRVRSPGARGAL